MRKWLNNDLVIFKIHLNARVCELREEGEEGEALTDIN